jgi:lauroyl/myristoyl acyltransferase
MKRIFIIIAYLVYYYPIKTLLRLIGYTRAIHLAERSSFLLAIFSRKKIEKMRENCRVYFSESMSEEQLEDVIRRFLRNFLKLNVNRLFFDKISREQCFALSTFHGLENFHDVLSLQKGAVLLFCHNSSHTLALHCLGGVTGKKPHIYTFHEMDNTRNSFDTFITGRLIDHHKKGFAVIHQRGLRDFYKSLKSGDITAIAFDGVRGEKFINVPFGRCSLEIAEGIYKISIRTGAPILPFFSSYDPGVRIHTYIGRPITGSDMFDIAGAFIKEFEKFVNKNPQDWSGWTRLAVKGNKGVPQFQLKKEKVLI